MITPEVPKSCNRRRINNCILTRGEVRSAVDLNLKLENVSLTIQRTAKLFLIYALYHRQILGSTEHLLSHNKFTKHCFRLGEAPLTLSASRRLLVE